MFNNIKILGMGSAFSHDFSPTAFAYCDNDTMYFIEANQSTFDFLKDSPDLSNINNYVFMISHFHEDHIGCLGNCIALLVFMLKINIDDIKIMTLDVKTCRSYLRITMPAFKNIEIIKKGFKVNHAEHMVCCGFAFDNTVYTGDCIETPENIISNFNDGKTNLITECSIYENVNVHQYLPNLLDKINFEHLDKLLLVHHDSLETFIKSISITLEKFSQLDVININKFKQFVLNELDILPRKFDNERQLIYDKTIAFIEGKTK